MGDQNRLPVNSFALATQLNIELQNLDIVGVLSHFSNKFEDRIVLASSFGPEDVVLIHFAAMLEKPIRVMTLDTGRLHPQTYDLMDKIKHRYNVELEVYFPEASDVEALVREKGFHSFYDSIEARRQCCNVRKVAPLKRALSTADAWITGMRQEQSPTRTKINLVEFDILNGNLLKINPLKDWDSEQLWAFIKQENIPYNVLHDQGFASIGCAPCTRAIKEGEPERAGRWWWEAAENKECGLHAKKGPGEGQNKQQDNG